jgi:phosphohistidine phosphatase
MKTLLLLRHAKSSWSDESVDDHDRPLNQRGKQEAPRMGQLLLDEHLIPDIIISSDAKRCRRTVEKLVETCGYRGETILTSELYLAPPRSYLKVLSRLDERVTRALVVGHNPALEELVDTLIGKYEPMTTAALALIELSELTQWSQIGSETRGRLVHLWQPRELA